MELLQAILDKAGITQWDLLLVGDGSGNKWHAANGWCCVLLDRLARGRRLHYGAMDAGSINLAEGMPYLQALNWYDNNGGKQRLRDQGTLNVHVITDSQVIAGWGTAAATLGVALPRNNAVIWAGMRELGRLGYRMHYHWCNRATSGLNNVADLIAGLCRLEMIDLKLYPSEASIAMRAAEAIDRVRFADPATGEPISIYHINPEENPDAGSPTADQVERPASP